MLTFTVVDPAALAAVPPTRATRAELRLAAAAGIAAYEADRPRAPGADATIMSLVAESAVGEPRTLELFDAFTAAYEAEVEAAVARLGL